MFYALKPFTNLEITFQASTFAKTTLIFFHNYENIPTFISKTRSFKVKDFTPNHANI